ncbi:hypothetical protein [Aeoliella sp. SH292]|uniref:hypothetical protein n=1 Tax=Aeoliella sp. SH292 TaxID=3454464 RepID=UPI003F988AAC
METTKQKSSWAHPYLLVAAALFALIGFAMYIRSGPRWELSTTNTPAGIEVEVYKEEEPDPTFKTLLPNHQTNQDLRRVNMDTFPPSVGKITHRDETVKPGQWTLVLDGVELNIMPGRMIIDKTTEIDPLK